MSQALNSSTVRRLAFIRFLYLQGLEQAGRPQPLAATALLSFHDAVEMFLLLAAEHLNVNLDRNTTFDGYWTQIAAQAGVQLPSRNAMRRMNNSRVNFKHHGSIPSATDLDQFRGDVTTFFTDATQAVFAGDFTSIDMTDLITQQAALTRIRDAETHASQGDYVEALALLSEALDDLLDDYADRKRTSYSTTAFSFGPEHALTNSRFAISPRSTLSSASKSWPSPTRWARCSTSSAYSQSGWTTAATRASTCSCLGSSATWTGTGKYGRCRVSRSLTRNTSSASCS